MNTPVSFELAKLLKEKGFDEYCKLCVEEGDERPLPFNAGNILHKNSLHPYYSTPTIAEVVMWLYEKHGIWIGVDCDCYGILWYANLSVASEKNWDNIHLRHEIISASKKFPNEHNSPTEAYEAAILYTLNNLI